MGYRTPNIDRIANEGIAFTDYYGQQSCTAGRAAFITGPESTPHRHDEGRDASLASRSASRKIQPSRNCSNHWATLRASSERTTLATGMNICRQCADSMSSTVSSITSTQKRNRKTLTIPKIRDSLGTRARECWTAGATAKDDSTTDPRFGRVGKQTVKDTGILTKKRMETVDDEITERALGFIDQSHKSGKPFFMWFNTTAMHFRTHCAPKQRR